MFPANRDELRQRIESGETFEYHLFYGHKPLEDGAVTAACFSLWFVRPFGIDGTTYPTAEHRMMAEKARLFKDEETLAKILVAPSQDDKSMWPQSAGF